VWTPTINTLQLPTIAHAGAPNGQGDKSLQQCVLFSREWAKMFERADERRRRATISTPWSPRCGLSLREKSERRGLKALLGLVSTVLTAWWELVVDSKTQRRRGDTREWVYTYRLSFPTVHDGTRRYC
jgi:hypothetical protein